LEAGARLWPEPPQFLPTIAEGIRLQQAGDVTFPIMCQYTAKKVFTVTDEAMINAMKWSWENLKLVIEVSSAPGVAVVLSQAFHSETATKIGVILCGGNCSVEKLLWT
jgi:threonine dehydratase